MKRLIASVAAVLLMAGVGASAHAEIVVNGSFETGDFTGWTTYPTPPGDNAKIVYVGEFVGPFGTENRVYDGTYAVDFNFNELPATAVLSQTVATTGGTIYDLKFAFGAISNPSKVASLTADVLGADGTTVLLSRSVSVLGTPLATWDEFDNSFMANGASATIRFTDTTPDSSSCDGLLDKVSVSAVPEPSTLVLLGVGAIGLLAYAWRRGVTAKDRRINNCRGCGGWRGNSILATGCRIEWSWFV